MSGLDQNRLRNQMVSFRVSPNEGRELEARVKLSGMPKGEFIVSMCLHGAIGIKAGKYQSDRLSLEIRKLREWLEMAYAKGGQDNMQTELLRDCIALIAQIARCSEATTN